MKQEKIGISNIDIYCPAPVMSTEKITEERVRWNKKLERHFKRAARVTGQKSFRFPETHEDTATIAAESAFKLLDKMDQQKVQNIRYLTVGTETGLDHSKPVSAYVQGMLTKAGIRLPNKLASFQVQHACAGGTLALMSTAGLLQISPNIDDSGIVIASDISRYESATTAEVTQGAGAAALLIEKNPKLIELNLETQGYCSEDVDDFFRPLDSKTAKVKGKLSVDCYNNNLDIAFRDHCSRRGQSPQEVLNETDLFILHTPYKNMPQDALVNLCSRYMHSSRQETLEFINSRGFAAGIKPLAYIGNTYTASMYMALYFLLADEYKKHGHRITGKKIMLASYGSGNTMIVLEAIICDNAVSVISSWDIDAFLNSKHDASWEDYLTWLNSDSSETEISENPYSGKSKSFVLKNVRPDGYREYVYMDQIAQFKKKNNSTNNRSKTSKLGT